MFSTWVKQSFPLLSHTLSVLAYMYTLHMQHAPLIRWLFHSVEKPWENRKSSSSRSCCLPWYNLQHNACISLRTIMFRFQLLLTTDRAIILSSYPCAKYSLYSALVLFKPKTVSTKHKHKHSKHARQCPKEKKLI